MKKALIVFLAAAFAASALAQSAGPRGGGVEPPTQGGGQRGGALQGALKRQQEIFAKLDLTADQKQKMQELNKKFMAQLKELRDKSKGDRKAVAPEMRKLNQDHREAVMAILTEEQKKKAAQLMKEMRAKGGEPGAKRGDRKGDKKGGGATGSGGTTSGGTTTGGGGGL